MRTARCAGGVCGCGGGVGRGIAPWGRGVRGILGGKPARRLGVWRRAVADCGCVSLRVVMLCVVGRCGAVGVGAVGCRGGVRGDLCGGTFRCVASHGESTGARSLARLCGYASW